MQIDITGRGLELTPSIKNYVTGKISRLDKLGVSIIKAHVVLSVITKHHKSGDIFECEVSLDIPGPNLFVKEAAEEMHAAIDLTEKRLKENLSRRRSDSQPRGFGKYREVVRGIRRVLKRKR